LKTCLEWLRFRAFGNVRVDKADDLLWKLKLNIARESWFAAHLVGRADILGRWEWSYGGGKIGVEYTVASHVGSGRPSITSLGENTRIPTY
jgi:hypothetical protein